MEHDIEKTIREKVKAVEQQPVHWERDEVWKKIDLGLKPKKKALVFYYIAASVTLAAVLGIYSWQLSYNRQINRQLKSLELAVATTNTDQAIVNELGKAIQECAEEESTEVPKEKFKRSPRKKVEPTHSQLNSLADHERTIELPIAKIEEANVLTEEASVSTKEIRREANPVEPVIGVIIPEKETLSIAKEKKVKLRLFRSPDKDFERKDDDSKTIIARIN